MKNGWVCPLRPREWNYVTGYTVIAVRLWGPPQSVCSYLDLSIYLHIHASYMESLVADKREFHSCISC